MTPTGPTRSDAPVLSLLLAAARPPGLGMDHGAFAAMLPRSEDSWDEVLEAARHHRLTPLLLHRLTESGLRTEVPAGVLHRLRHRAAAVGVQSLMLAGALVEIVESLDAEGIRSLAFKGPALSHRLYGGLGLRPFRDVDLLVHGSDFSRALRVVEGVGYSLRPGSDPRSLDSPTYYHAQLARGSRVLELHRALVPVYHALPGDLETYWPRRELFELAGREVATLGVEDALLHLATHGSGHGWYRLHWLVDLLAWAHQASSTDWRAVMARAQRLGMGRAFLLGWHLIDRWLDAAIPGALAVAVRSSGRLRRLGEACAGTWWPPVLPTDDEVRFGAYQLLLLEGWRRKATFIRTQGRRTGLVAAGRALLRRA